MQVATLRKDLEDLTRDHSPCPTLIEDLKRQVDDLKMQLAEVAKLRMDNAQLTTQRDHWRDEQRAVSKVNMALQKEVEELKIEISALVKECEQLRFNHSECDETILTLRETNATQRNEYDKLRCRWTYIATVAIVAGDRQSESYILTDSGSCCTLSESCTSRAMALSHPYARRLQDFKSASDKRRRKKYQSFRCQAVEGCSAQLLQYSFLNVLCRLSLFPKQQS